MNDNAEMFVFAMTLLICTTLVIRSIVSAFAQRRRPPEPATSALDPALHDRMDRLERAIDTIAVEVERVSEAQRFVTRVLTERKIESAPPALPQRTTTPH